MISAVFSAIFLSFIASAVILNYKFGRMLNLSLSSLFTLGAYIGISKTTFGGLMCILLGAASGYLISAVTRKLSTAEATIASLGFAILIEELLRLLFRSSYYIVQETEYIRLFGETVSVCEVASSAFLLLILIFIIIITAKKELKLVEDDWELAEICGVDTYRIRLWVISATSAVVCFSGYLLSPTKPVFPAMGWSVVVPAVIVAAISSIYGSVGNAKYALTLPVALAYTALLRLLP